MDHGPSLADAETGKAGPADYHGSGRMARMVTRLSGGIRPAVLMQVARERRYLGQNRVCDCCGSEREEAMVARCG